MHKKIYEYVNADIIDTKQNIHLANIEKICIMCLADI